LLEPEVALPETIESFFIQIDHTLVPYQVEQCTLQGHQAIIKFQAIDNATTAHQLKGSALFALRADLPQPIAAEEYHQAWAGYQVVDIKKGSLGTVQRVETLPLQKLLVVNYLENELLIPYHAAIIKQVDHAQKNILIHLPPGFIEAVC